MKLGARIKLKSQKQLKEKTEIKKERKPKMNLIHVVKGDTEPNCALKQ